MAWWKFWAADSDRMTARDYYEEGVALMGRELHHEALTSFRLALREDPDDAATHEQLAVCYTHIGIPDEAIRSYRRALELRPDSTSAHYGLAFLLLKAGERREAARHLEAFLAHARPGREEGRHLEHARRTLARLADDASTHPPDASTHPPDPS